MKEFDRLNQFICEAFALSDNQQMNFMKMKLQNQASSDLIKNVGNHRLKSVFERRMTKVLIKKIDNLEM